MKMKRIAAAVLATVMAVSLSACGTNSVSTGSEDTGEVQVKTERTDNEKPDSDDSAASAVTDATEQTEQTEQTTTTTTTTAPEEPEVPVELPLMNAEPRLIMNGCMAFKCDGKNYVYNITDNELYETEYDVNDITALNGCVAIVGYLSYYDFSDYYRNIDKAPYVVNIKTGERYSDVVPIACNNNHITVGKLEEGFSENTFSIGMLNNKGEWVLPLSDKHAVCKINDIEKISWTSQNKNFISTFINGFIYLYDVKTDEITSDDLTSDGCTGIWVFTDESAIMYTYTWNGGIDSYYTIFKQDESTGDKTVLFEKLLEKQYNSDYSHVNNAYVYYADGIFRTFDLNFNHIADYDLSEYVNDWRDAYKNMLNANEDVLIFTAKNKSNDLYTIILNKDGNTVCEPVKGDIGMPYFSENKIVFVSDDADRIIDISTGEITEYDDSFDIVNYDDVNDLMIVKSGDAYYLADPEAPDTLINPFERAYN